MRRADPVGSPSAELQARFVTQLQRLLTEGQFVNTYKFALLLALTRWAVENPEHDEAVAIDARELAPHFLDLYWPHVLPFHTEPALGMVAESRPTFGSDPDATWQHVLVQDQGQWGSHQVPRVLKKIREARAGGASHPRELPSEQRERLVTEIRKSIVDMPLWRLHTVRDSTEPMRFLYREGTQRHTLRFEHGAVACLAHFAPLIEQTVRAAWIRHVVGCNPHLLGASSTVEAFLFPGSRANLQPWREVIHEFQGDRCFYCERAIHGTPAVDHFLPWSRYPRDLGPNFVLAHATCNQQKSDHLPAIDHLTRWVHRNEEHAPAMAQRFGEERLPYDWQTLRRVATSLYRLAEANGASLWRHGAELVPIEAAWRALLGVA